ncbi:hypothetical protein [Actinokineospora globicatena]|uniref:Uncharacterized protein n=1 Tax=Actinokineospora globicatena TaxID=103729 RepID=A0A9W6VAS7_9PSEU|nr:hypothetical protein [Actinokineospora globicatena]GLW92421.1 hypothetical protein Aglo03_32370 [Actinokineospora globicatena]
MSVIDPWLESRNATEFSPSRGNLHQQERHVILETIINGDLATSAKVAGGVIQFFFDRWIDMSSIR